MDRYTYRAYYDDSPTARDPHRQTKSDDEIQALLMALPSHLVDRFPHDATIEAADIERRDVGGISRLTRLVTIASTIDEKIVKGRIEVVFNELYLYGEPKR